MKLSKSLEMRLAVAHARHESGLNCAQCVALAFDDVVDPEAIKVLEAATSALGAGMGDLNQTCGCLTGAHVVQGLVAYKSPKEKLQMYRIASDFNSVWMNEHQFHVCKDLKEKGTVPCSTLIDQTICMLHDRLMTL